MLVRWRMPWAPMQRYGLHPDTGVILTLRSHSLKLHATAQRAKLDSTHRRMAYALNQRFGERLTLRRLRGVQVHTSYVDSVEPR